MTDNSKITNKNNFIDIEMPHVNINNKQHISTILKDNYIDTTINQSKDSYIINMPEVYSPNKEICNELKEEENIEDMTDIYYMKNECSNNIEETFMNCFDYLDRVLEKCTDYIESRWNNMCNVTHTY
tara:strand:+ start:75 stop:455 length:381 start_codon:yes stop_codon:yes gene_type:complete